MKFRINDELSNKSYALFVILLMSNIDILTLNSILFGVGRVYYILRIVLYTTMITLFALGHKRILRLKKDAGILLVLIFLLFSLSYLLSPQTREVIVIERLFRGVFFSGITGYIFIRNLNDADMFIDVMEKTSYFMITYGGLILIFGNIGNAYMGFAYSILIYVLLLLYVWLFKKSKLGAIFGVFGVFIELAGGARGILLCVAFVFLSYFVFTKKWKRAIIFFTLIGILYVSFDYIFSALYRIMQLAGINSRTLSAYSGLGLESITYANGRLTIYKTSIELIKNNPLGYGFLGERFALNDEIWWFNTNGYAHNIFLELILQFGILIGGFLCIALLIIIIKTIRKSDFETSISGLFLVFLSYNINLLVSRSYTTSFQFWVMLGLIFLIHNGRNNVKY